MKLLLSITVFIFFISCSQNTKNQLKKGTYRAFLKIKDNQELPFIFKVKNDTLLKIYNADEIIKVDEIIYKNDSVYIHTPVFEGYIVAKIFKNMSLHGYFIKPSLNRTVPFKAEIHNSSRFKTTKQASFNITGNWETIFSPNNKKDTYIAKGIFTQK